MMIRIPMAIFTGLAILLGCGGERSERRTVEETEEVTAPSQFEDISVSQLREIMVIRDFVLVNVHIPFDGDIPDTDVSIPFDEISSNLDRLPEDRGGKIVLYCRSGNMSAEASATLASLGYTEVFNLTGGMLAWKAAGFEIVGGLQS